MGLADRAYMYEPRAPEPGRRGRSGVKGARRASDPRIMTVMLSVVGTGLLMILQLANRYGIPSFDEPTGPVQSFPGTGDVFVTKFADLSHGQSIFSVSVPPTDRYNYVVLLVDAETGHSVMAIYCRSGDQTVVPVPVGSYRVRAASGMDWYGMKGLFGAHTHVEEVVATLTVTSRMGQSIDFNRRPDGNLPTRPMLKSGFGKSA